MNEINILVKQKFIFGKLFLLSNKLQIAGDQILTDDMTVMQWLLTAAIAKFGDTPPTLSEIALLMSSSHQNAKQLALKLEKRGFLTIEKDEQDLRATRLKLTEKSFAFWQKRQDEIKDFLIELFKGLNKDEINSLYDCLNKLYRSILKIEKSLKSYERVF